jgi:hypothetical protein
MDVNRSQALHAEAADSVRWEPCSEPTVDDGGSLCGACGWTVDDHDLDRPVVAARAA